MQPFIPAAVLKQTFSVFGHFYAVGLPSKEVIECRSVLEIAASASAPRDRSELLLKVPDALFIMMNPGSSRPLVPVNNQIRARSIHNLAASLVPARPDTTQYQVMRLMLVCRWRHVRVLNLSDLRNANSAEFFKAFKRLEQDLGFEGHSIFSEARAAELSRRLPARGNSPLILAWGTSRRLDGLIDRCLLSLPQKGRRLGLLAEGSANKYRHPLPSLWKDQRQWLARMICQCDALALL
jgi:hypothetical protein